MKKFILGFITGGMLAAAVTGFAVEYVVNVNPYPVKVDGIETAIEGYNINNSTYFKLRDVADAVGGFNVDFKDNTIILDTEAAPEPTTAPDIAASDITIIKGEDGLDYTEDGLKVEHTSDGDYVFDWDILNMLKSKGVTQYEFAGKYFFKKGSTENILDDIPVNPQNKVLIPLNYYISTLKPIVDNLKAE